MLPVREDGEDREIWIFVEDGYLQAATVKSGDVVSAKDGKNITPLRSMDPRIAGLIFWKFLCGAILHLP